MILSSSSSCMSNIPVFFVFLPVKCFCLLRSPACRIFLSSQCSCLPNVSVFFVFLPATYSYLHCLLPGLCSYLPAPPSTVYLPVWCSDLLNVLVKLIFFLLPIAELICLFCVLTCPTHHVFLCLLSILCCSLILHPT
jgi:hypothetical protein